MRTIGTVVRGVRAPIIREGDNIAEVAAASVMEAWKEAGIEPRDRDVVAVVAHMAVQKIAVGHVLMAGIHGPGMTRRGEAVLRHVEAGQHLHNAGDGLRRGLVD